MQNLTEAQQHLYNILDGELSVMEHPSCSVNAMRARVVSLINTLEPYLGCHIDMNQDADFSGVNPTDIKGLIRYARSVRTFDEYLQLTSRVIGTLMTQEERREFFGEDAK